MTHEWFTADQGDVHRLVRADQPQNAIDEGIAAKIVQISQNFLSSKMGIAVGVTARTA
jgi:hypothetical protein